MSESPKSPRSPLRDEPINSPVAVASGSASPAAGTAPASGTGGSLFVGRLAFDCRTRELEDLFGKYGRITRCDIKRGKPSCQPSLQY